MIARQGLSFVNLQIQNQIFHIFKAGEWERQLKNVATRYITRSLPKLNSIKEQQ